MDKKILDAATQAALAKALKPAPLSPDRQQAIYARLMQRLHAPTESPSGTRTIRSNQLSWNKIDERIEVKILYRNPERNEQLALIRCYAGARLPAHPHHQDEECLVLEGSIRIGQHIINQGDLHIAQAGSAHDVIIAEHGAVLLLRSEIQTSL